MMIVDSVKCLDVESDPGIGGEGLEPFINQLSIKAPDLIAVERRPKHQQRAPRQVDGDACQRLIHRHMHIRIAGDAFHVAESLLHRLASAIPTSSVVWWWSMCRSPVALTVMSIR